MTRTILVSGAGSGIGRATAIALAASAADLDLILVGRRLEPLLETKELLSRPTRHAILATSQADKQELQKALSSLDLKSRNLVGVVANAGVGGENSYGDGDRWDEIIQTNLSGTYHLLNQCLPALQASTAPKKDIVIVASIMARLGVAGYSAYSASKAGLLGLMRSMAAAHAKEKIYVNAVLPGWVNTQMARQGIEQFAVHTNKSYETILGAQMRMVPTGKMSEPEEIADMIAFVMSSRQTSLTGQCFDINNGALMP